MSLLPLFEYGFRFGCNENLVDILSSDEFRKALSDQQSLRTAYNPRSNAFRALHIGHINARGAYRQTEGGKKPWPKLNTYKLTKQHQIERALVQVFGGHLIRAAYKCLPEALIELIPLFTSARTAKGQRLVLKSVYEALDPRNYGQGGETISEPKPDWFESQFIPREIDRNLPFAYGRGETLKPGCLGVCLMLAAFANATGYPFMVCGIVEYYQDAVYRAIEAIDSVLLKDILDHNCDWDNFGQERLKGAIGRAQRRKFEPHDFHTALAIKLKNRKWFLLDPYMDGFEYFEIQVYPRSCYSELNNFRAVLPGLTIFCQHWHGMERLTRAWLELIPNWIGSIKNLVDNLPEGLDDADEFIRLAASYKDLNSLTDWFLSISFVDTTKWVPVETIPYIIFDVDLGKENTEAKLQAAKQKFKTDSGYRANIIRRLRVLPHLMFHDRAVYFQTLGYDHGSLHPTLEFALPEYNLGWMVLSNTLSDHPELGVDGKELLHLSTSPILWHEACDLSQNGYAKAYQNGILAQAEQAARLLPRDFQYPIIQKKLDYLEKFRKERANDPKTSS